MAAAWEPSTADQRVRLQLARTGALQITHGDIVPSKAELVVGLAEARLDPADPFLKHKTTRRAVYECAFQAGAAQGWDEVVFLNRRGQVAEASRNSVFVEVGGRLITPPLASGILPGVLRRDLIDQGRALEGEVSIGLLTSRPLWLGNSLHGLRAAQMPGV